MKLETFAEELKSIYGDDLISLVLFGSAAGGDFHEGYSDFNTMIVLKDISLKNLARGAGLCQRWVSSKNPFPLFVDRPHLATSLDVFPIEFLDMKDQYKIIYGQDVLAGLSINSEHLRLECESELKGKLIALRSAWLEAYPSPRKLKKVLLQSSSSFFAIFRGILRLSGETVPLNKRDVLARLNAKTQFDTSVFEKILEVKEERRRLSRSEVLPLMEDYLTTLERVASFVDKL